MKINLKLKQAALCLALGAVALTGSIAPAHADPRHDFHHQDHRRDWHRGHDGPGYVYAPPVVYSPPPESSGINLIVPFNFH